MPSELSIAQSLFDEGNDKRALPHLQETINKSNDADVIDTAAALAERIRDRTEGRLKRRAATVVEGRAWAHRRIKESTFGLVATINFVGLGNASVTLRPPMEQPAERVTKEAET